MSDVSNYETDQVWVDEVGVDDEDFEELVKLCGVAMIAHDANESAVQFISDYVSYSCLRIAKYVASGRERT